MITISLNQIKANGPCVPGWDKLIASKGVDFVDMDMQFPVTDIIDSNGLCDALWATRCLPEHDNLWRKLAVSYARDVQHLMTDRRSIAVLDVAWRHSDGLATDEELRAAADAADAADAAAGVAGVAGVAWAAAAAARAADAAAWAAAAAAAWAAAEAASRAAAAAATRAASRAASRAADAAGVAWAAEVATWAASQQKQRSRLIAVLNAGKWVEVVA